MPRAKISIQFGSAVRSKRLAAGLSQEELAERVEIHSTYVGMIERGLRNPTLDVAARIAAALKVSLPKLIEEAEGFRPGKSKKG